MRSFLLICILGILLTGESLRGQDLNASVQVLSPRVQNTNKNSIKVLSEAIREFLNGRKWTDLELKPAERIDCTFLITINEWDGGSNYRAEAQIVSSRPVYGSTYLSPMLTLSDKSFNFSYIDSQPLDYNDQTYISNLSSLLAFYANIIVGIDADSFGQLRGTPYFERARAIVNNAQNSGFGGWKASEDYRNRFWLAENFNDRNFISFREFSYHYHRSGLDMFYKEPGKGAKAAADALPRLLTADLRRAGAYYNQLFFSTKSDELIQVLSRAPYDDRLRAYSVLAKTDPANAAKYSALGM